MTDQTRDLRNSLYVVYDTDKNLRPEVDMMREVPWVVVEQAHNQEELVKALRIPSSLMFISAHGFHANDGDLFFVIDEVGRVGDI